MPYHPNLAHPLVRDMAAWWLYDPDLAAGNIWYDTLREKNGGFANSILNSGVSWQADELSCDGVTGQIACPILSLDCQQLTISYYMRVLPYNESFANSVYAEFSQNSNSNVNGSFWLGSYTDGVNAIATKFASNIYSVPGDDLWTYPAPSATRHFFTHIFDRSTASPQTKNVFVDNLRQPLSPGSTQNMPAGTFFGSYPLYLGRRGDNSIPAVPFGFRSFMFHRRALSATEVSQLYTESLNGYPNMLWRPKKRFFYGPSVTSQGSLLATYQPNFVVQDFEPEMAYSEILP